MSEGSEVGVWGGRECGPALESARFPEPGHTQGPDAESAQDWDSLIAQLVKNLHAMQETWV